MTITLNRPDVLNAFNGELHAAFQAALEEAADVDVRAVVITGAGRAFCVGQDLTEFQMLDVADALRSRYHRNVTAIRALNKPVIAAVNGPAAGAGLSLACACDIRVAAEGSSFVPAFINIGLVPDSGGTYFIHRLIGTSRAFSWLVSGRRLSAAEAETWGIVSEVVPDEQLQVRVQELAQQLAAMPTLGIGWTKQALDRAQNASLEEQLELEARLQARATQTPDFREGVAAFLEKRPPEFTGRPPKPYHPVELVVDDDLVRWRLTVFFRWLLAIPHAIVSQLWGLVVVLVAVWASIVALLRGRLPDRLHGFLERWLRYWVHVNAYTYLVADPFPKFRGWPGTYPIDLEVAPPAPQARWKTAFRLLLAIPAFILARVLLLVLQIVAVIGWFIAVFTAKLPKGMRDLAAYCIRFEAQTYAYLLLLTDRYPSLAQRAPQRPPGSSGPGSSGRGSGGPVRQ
jgi:2-(1,2-epoxy-1,2-dihydrophenyl)acetyl-CoA isomerase